MDAHQSPKLKADLLLMVPDASPDTVTRLVVDHEFNRSDDNSALFSKRLEGTYSDMLLYANTLRAIAGTRNARLEVIEEEKPQDIGSSTGPPPGMGG